MRRRHAVRRVGATLVVARGSTDGAPAWDAVACADIAGYAVYGANSYAAPFPSGWTLLSSPTAAASTDPLASPVVTYTVVSLDACGNPSGD